MYDFSTLSTLLLSCFRFLFLSLENDGFMYWRRGVISNLFPMN
jgi:hypothetical protein